MKKSGIYLILAGLVTIFIFSNSLQSATESSQTSNGLRAQLIAVLPFLDAVLTTHNIRKAAHFIEFFIQGSFLTLSGLHSKAGLRQSMAKIAFAGLFTACLDESLQNFSVGRSPEVSDIFVDFAGTVVAFVLLTLFFTLRRKKNVRI